MVVSGGNLRTWSHTSAFCKRNKYLRHGISNRTKTQVFLFYPIVYSSDFQTVSFQINSVD